MSHVSNRGKGVALRTGFHYAVQSGFDYILTMDSDGQHDPEEIPKLLAAAEHAAIVIGHRQDGDRMPAARRLTNQLMSAIVSRLIRQRIPDSQCGFRAFRAHVLKEIPLSTAHFDLETEVLLAASRRGWTITSVPVRTIYQSHGSHIHPLFDGLRFIRLIVWHVLNPRGSASVGPEARS
jgi:glycosyltransferase involved in cell wall biosynthesis